jgi:hypothetical protein
MKLMKSEMDFDKCSDIYIREQKKTKKQGRNIETLSSNLNANSKFLHNLFKSVGASVSSSVTSFHTTMC